MSDWIDKAVDEIRKQDECRAFYLLRTRIILSQFPLFWDDLEWCIRQELRTFNNRRDVVDWWGTFSGYGKSEENRKLLVVENTKFPRIRLTVIREYTSVAAEWLYTDTPSSETDRRSEHFHTKFNGIGELSGDICLQSGILLLNPSRAADHILAKMFQRNW